MAAKDYYKILGISKSASADEIKRAFRKLANEHHPDRGNGNAEKFKEVNEAYQVLSDTEKRSQYDQYGTTFDAAQAQGQGFGGFSGFQQGNVDFGNLEDLVGGIGDMFGFGGGRGRSRKAERRGKDIETAITIDFHDAVFGIEKTVELYKPVSCDRCNGSGAEPGSILKSCATCGGQGQVQQTQRTVFGQFATVVTCPKCSGEGSEIKDACSRCGGRGATRETKQMKLKIPAGIDDGQTIRLAREGEAGERGATAGDLYVTVHVKKDPRFVRDGETIRTEVRIPYSTVVLGGSVDVETVDGVVQLKIPAGTKSGQEFRLKGKGIPHLKSTSRGDQYVTISVDTPQSPTRKQRQLLEELQKEGL
ncbi:molecular chaperone DnaJ [Candidatus Uhrbacteria bacterium]|nr:molecular chaperone DnaJ [Candidatus Uhrbacteria bacterium]